MREMCERIDPEVWKVRETDLVIGVGGYGGHSSFSNRRKGLTPRS